jgi:hypothetical protein
MGVPSNEQYQLIADALFDGELVLFVGAGANLCDRPKISDWELGRYLPSGTELAEYLASIFRYPYKEHWDLVRVSEYAALMRGIGPLYEKLHNLFDEDYPITKVHQFLADLPAILRKNGCPSNLLILTTNYDDLMERALRKMGESFDVVTYEAEGDHTGKFWHLPLGGVPRVIDKPNEYADLSVENRTVLLKIHGTVNRANAKEDSYVITEDHYIEFLARTSIPDLVPITLLDKLRNSHVLFLGYSLQDWNLRVILRHIWGENKFKWVSWAVQLDPRDMDTRFWNKRDVEIFNLPLITFVEDLEKVVRSRATPGA